MPGVRLAPTTATERGARIRAIDAASEWCSRPSIAACDEAVGSIENSTRTVPSANTRLVSQPASRSTPSILRLCGSVSAANAVMPLARDRGEVLEEQGSEASTLLVVANRERDLGRAFAGAVVARHRDELIGELRDERHVIAVVDRLQPLELRRRGARDRREEPEVDRFVGHVLVEREQPGVVVGADRAQVDRAAVGEHHVARPLSGVLGHRRFRRLYCSTCRTALPAS